MTVHHPNAHLFVYVMQEEKFFTYQSVGIRWKIVKRGHGV